MHCKMCLETSMMLSTKCYNALRVKTVINFLKLFMSIKAYLRLIAFNYL